MIRQAPEKSVPSLKLVAYYRPMRAFVLALTLALLTPAFLGEGRAWARPAASHQARTAAPRHKVGSASHKRRVLRKPARRAQRRARYVPTYTRGGLPNVQAQAALVLDLATGQPLYQKNPDAVRPIASLSKLMAMLVLSEHGLDLQRATTILDADARLTTRGAKSRLLVGMTLSNRDLLHAALMASDNRAVLALGRSAGFSPPALAAAMTAKAAALGMKHTQFGDPTGLDYRNVSTPREVIVMLQAALKVPHIAAACRQTHYVARSTSRPVRLIEYNNTDVLLRATKHVVHGGKTGYNDRAGYCLVVSAKISGGAPAKAPSPLRDREVAMAFLGEVGKDTRFADFSRAAQWLVEKRPIAGTDKQAKADDKNGPG